MTTPHPGTREYRNQTVRITDLAVVEDLIVDVRFENCEIIGPAVLALLDGLVMNSCVFDSDGPEQLFWVVPDERPSVIGAIGLQRTEFYSCRFRKIGLAVPASRLEEIRSGFGF
ncbi:hypothetical protein [uncultured Friedmanniella sp.]|uniref:hypothetical protein n=1 Tax=uncultured Friedmanniella sp. TaxID=335381 RepID=UPI0035CC2C18